MIFQIRSQGFHKGSTERNFCKTSLRGPLNAMLLEAGHGAAEEGPAMRRGTRRGGAGRGRARAPGDGSVT